MVPVATRADGTITRPRTWQRALELSLRGCVIPRTERWKQTDKKKLVRESVGTRAEDFADSHPSEARDTLLEVVVRAMSEGDQDGARHWADLLNAMEAWQEDGGTVPDPFGLDEPEEVAPMKEPKRTLEPEEVAALLTELAGPRVSQVRDQAIVAFLGYTGMRIGEALNLRVQDVRERDGELRIHVADLPGNKSGPRDFVFPPSLTPFYEAWLGVRYPSREPEDWLFTTSNGGKVSDGNIRTKMGAAGGRLGLKVHPHLLRHSFATNILRKDWARLSAVSKTLGHANPGITATIYAHANIKESDEMMRRV